MIAKFFDEAWSVVSGKDKKYSAKRLALITLAVVAVILVCGYYSALTLKLWSDPKTSNVRGLPLQVSWEIIAASMIVLLAFIGLQITDRFAGALIDDTNSMSLSRFQLVAWTVLVISTFLAMALARAFTGGIADVLNISVPAELWQLLGISAASATGRELILASKKATPLPDNAPATNKTATALAATGDPVPAQTIDQHRQGVVYRNASPAEASIVDMFQGDEVGNNAHVDMSKVQMFFFTIAALVAYASEVYGMLRTTTSAASLTAMPNVGSGLLLILSISHAAYLTNKGINHTPSN